MLKCEQGFVGVRQGSSKLECNKATYETIIVERAQKGIVYFKGTFLKLRYVDLIFLSAKRCFIAGQNGKYWRIDGDTVSVDGDTPTDGFYLELREPTRISIR